jgi:hypothetical protein
MEPPLHHHHHDPREPSLPIATNASKLAVVKCILFVARLILGSILTSGAPQLNEYDSLEQWRLQLAKHHWPPYCVFDIAKDMQNGRYVVHTVTGMYLTQIFAELALVFQETHVQLLTATMSPMTYTKFEAWNAHHYSS